MITVTEKKIGRTLSAIVCTVLFSTTCVLSAVGPARAANPVSAETPVVRPLA